MSDKYPTTWPCPVHPAAELFPMIEGQPFTELVTNIKKHGLHEPIDVTADGKLLDGRNRFRACLEADVPPKFKTFRGPGTAFQYVVSKNLHRRHLTTSQRSMIAAKIANMDQGARTDLASNEAMSQSEAAVTMKVSRSNVQRAKTVREKGAPEVTKAVDDGTLTLGAASDIITLPQEDQREVVQQVKKGAKPADAVAKKKKTKKEPVERALREEDADTDIRQALDALRHEVERAIDYLPDLLHEVLMQAERKEHYASAQKTLSHLETEVRKVTKWFDERVTHWTTEPAETEDDA